MPHAAFYVVQLSDEDMYLRMSCFNAARSILCGATTNCNGNRVFLLVSMPHAAFYVVQQAMNKFHMSLTSVSMPHAAFYVVQRQDSCRK